MSLNYFLIWVICLSCTVSLGRLIFFAINPSRGWIIVYAFILIITLSLVYVIPTKAGLIGGALWGLFLILPTKGLAQVNQLRNQKRYREAYQIAAYMRWLHPADGVLEEPKFLQALSLAQQGRLEEAKMLLNSFKSLSLELNCQAEVLMYSMQAKWQDCLDVIQERLPYKLIFQNKSLTIYYLRALGETGNLNDLIQGVGLCENRWEKGGNWETLYFLQMMALAFAGKKAEVKQLFNTFLSSYPASVERFWFLTAVMAHHDGELVREEFTHLKQNQDWILSQEIDWRLANPPNHQQQLSYLSRQIMANIEKQLAEDRLESQLVAFDSKPAYLTYVLIGVNLIMFAVALDQGGSRNVQTLSQMGALIPQFVLLGDWWRLITGNFLHFGWVHLATNMLGLSFLGPFVEANLGKRSYLFLYLTSGIVTMGILTILAVKTGQEQQIFVGASAAIMGLFGCVCAIFVKIYQKGQYDFALRKLRLIILVLGVQFIFDWVTPQVSFVSHLSGLIIGFLLGLILLSTRDKSSNAIK